MSKMKNALEDYIFSGVDAKELDRKEDMFERYICDEQHDNYLRDIQRMPMRSRASRTFLIFVFEDKNNAFIYPAQALRRRIRRGDYDFNPSLDQVRLIDAHNIRDINDALVNNRNIFAIFIYGHSFGGSAGIGISDRRHERYNIAYSKNMKRSIPVNKLHKANVLPDGFIHLYSCNAISDSGSDIAHAMANHFGVKVWASKSGVSLWPPFVRVENKRGVYVNPSQRLFDKTTGFDWALPKTKE